MCNCRKEIEEKGFTQDVDFSIKSSKLSGYMLIPSGFQYLEIQLEGFRVTKAGNEQNKKKSLIVLGKFCMFCGKSFGE